MPNGFWYASGPCETDTRKPGSAFSKGDLLALDSNSSLSRLNPYAIVAGAVYAVATADSVDSIQDKVTAIVIKPDTRFWTRVEAGDALLTGGASGVSFAVGTNGRYFTDGSSTTPAIVCVEGTDKVDQSVQSKAIVQFSYHSGNLDLS